MAKKRAADISGDDTLAASASPHADHDELIAVDADHYAMGDEVARGGMGRILDARDRRAGRPVAIKEVLVELLRHLPEDDRAIMIRRFQREARITAGLQHPSIVPVYEIGRIDDAPFFAMKKVDGEPLDAVIDAASSVEARLALLPKIIAIAEALAYAHERGVIHRDLKPGNVLVGAHGETVVIDWGLAKQLDESDAGTSAPPVVASDGLETVVGSVFGTPLYMPLEQARGEMTDQRADVYAIGAMLYHLLAGHAPYRDRVERPTADAVLAALEDGPPTPLAELDEDIPADLISITARAMARDRDDRYDNAAGLAADLRQLQAGKLVAVHQYSIGELIRRWVKRHRGVVATAAVALAAVTSLTVWAFLSIAAERDRANDKATEARANELEAINILTTGGRDAFRRDDVTDAAFRLVQAHRLGSTSIALPTLLARVEASIDERTVRIGGDQLVLAVAGSAGSAYFGLVYDRHVEVIDARTGSIHRSLKPGPRIRGLTMDLEARRALLLLDQTHGAELWDIDGRRAMRRFSCETKQVTRAALTPDGTRVALMCSNGSMRLLNADDGALIGETVAEFALHRVYVSSDSQRLLTTIGGVALLHSLSSLALTSRHVLSRGPVSTSTDAALRTLVSVRSDGQIVVRDAESGADTLIASTAADQWHEPAVNLDGSTIIALRGANEAYVFNRDGSERTSVLFEGLELGAVNRDGTALATVGADRAVRVWDGRTGRFISEHVGLTRPSELRWVADDRVVALDAFHGALLIKVRDRGAVYSPPSGAIVDVHFSSSSDALLATTSDKTLLFRPSAGQLGQPVILSGSRSISQAGGVFVADRIATPDGVFSGSTGERIAPAPEHDKVRGFTRLSADGRTALIVAGLEVIFYDAATGREQYRATIPNPKKIPFLRVMAMAISPDGNTAVVGVNDGRVMVADRSATSPPTMLSRGPAARHIQISADGERLFLAAGGPDTLWDWRAKKRIVELQTQTNVARMSDDGGYFVRTFPRSAEVRDGRTGELVLQIPPVENRIVTAAVAGKHALIGCSDGLVEVWNIPERELIHRQHHAHHPLRSALAPDGSAYVVAHRTRFVLHPIRGSDAEPDALVERLRAVFSTVEFTSRYVIRDR